MDDEEWAAEFAAAGLTGWHVRGSTAHTSVGCGTFTAAGELAARIARTCDELDHHAEIDLRFPDLVRVTTWSHDRGGLTRRDLRLAEAVSALIDGDGRPSRTEP
jgi:4a-hydroxytetrahydrobiopterin dehydratase